MKKIVAFLIAFPLLIVNAEAQQAGIRFDNDLTWQQVKEKAKQEGKYIFVDCYATWCGPCKFMSQTIFPQQSVSDFINSRFISVEVQMDRTAHDENNVKAWYDDAASLAIDYHVTSYPTYLFFSPDGIAVHRIEGSSNDANEFISKVKDVFSPAKQYYTVIEHYREHLQDSAYLKKALEFAKNQNEVAFLAEAYFASLKSPFNRNNLMILASTIKSDTGSVSHFFADHAKQIEKIVGDYTLRAVIYNSEIFPLFQNSNKDLDLDWIALTKKLKNGYGPIADSVILFSKIIYYRWKKDDNNYVGSVVDFMKVYKNRLSEFELNQYAWNLFLSTNDKLILKQALSWSKSAIKNYPNCQPEFVDTYANLLYKSGNRKAAIGWENRAILMIDNSKEDIRKNKAIASNRADFVTNLSKMQNGQKTWN